MLSQSSVFVANAWHEDSDMSLMGGRRAVEHEQSRLILARVAPSLTSRTRLRTGLEGPVQVWKQSASGRHIRNRDG